MKSTTLDNETTTRGVGGNNGWLYNAAVGFLSLFLIWNVTTNEAKSFSGGGGSRSSIFGTVATKMRLSRNQTKPSSKSFPSSSAATTLPANDHEPFLVICTRLREEAPYIREWIEHHLALGFDHFILMNDKSADDTQCFLDVYKRFMHRGKPIVRLIKTQKEQGLVFDECFRIIQDETNHFNASNTWVLTNDLDEFLDFNSSRFHALKDAVAQLSQTVHDGQVKSFQIPRLAFGSSGHDYHLPGLMMERFTKRYDPSGCPSPKPQMPRCSKFAFCHKNVYSHTPFDSVKSMSQASAVATQCFSAKDNRCTTTHLHEIADPKLNGALQERLVTKSTMNPVYLKGEELLGSLAIAHYMIKSRQEFYQRICSSQFFEKYYRPEGCTPAINFEVMQESFDVYNDTRMLRHVRDVQVRLDQTDHWFEHCNTKDDLFSIPYNLSLSEYFQQRCWDPQELRMGNEG